MKVDFKLPSDKKKHEYCIFCHEENVRKKDEGLFECLNCGRVSPRVIVVSPDVVSWVDEKSKIYWHESVGVMLRNEQKKILLFRRIIYPYAYSIPAGHLDPGELPETGAARELQEETGLVADNGLRLFVREEVENDECRRGVDHHLWNLYVGNVTGKPEVRLNEEGTEPEWLTLREIQEKNLVVPVRVFVEKYGEKLLE